MFSSEAAISAYTTLIVILDPVGLVPIFLSLTAKMTTAQRMQTGLRAALIACSVLIFFAVFGAGLLGALGISVPAFRIAGGLMLFYTAFEMVFGARRARRQASAEADQTLAVKTTAAFPLAIPLMAGPGAITACILLAGQAQGQPAAQITLALVIIGACATALICFVAAEPLNRMLGETGKIVLTRLLGVLLSALAVQFIADGIVAIANQATA